MTERILCAVLIGALSSLAGAACYKLVYVDSACAMAPCDVPSDPPPCKAPQVKANWPVYTTRTFVGGLKRTIEDRACEVVWKVRDEQGNCNVEVTCVNLVGSFNLDETVECHSGVPE
jgi:hypothetical protein